MWVWVWPWSVPRPRVPIRDTESTLALATCLYTVLHSMYSAPSSTYTAPCHCPRLDSVEKDELCQSAWGVMQVTPRSSKGSRGSRATELTNSERSTALSRLAGSSESRLPAWRASLFRAPTDASAEHNAPRDALLYYVCEAQNSRASLVFPSQICPGKARPGSAAA